MKNSIICNSPEGGLLIVPQPIAKKFNLQHGDTLSIDLFWKVIEASAIHGINECKLRIIDEEKNN